jgi:hypothetical protein
MVTIYKNGKAVQRSKNLRGMRRYVHGFRLVWVEKVTVQRREDGGGFIAVRYSDGAEVLTDFASYDIMLGWILNWRNARGAAFYVQIDELVIECGKVEPSNHHFREAYR